jgi:hypothetical protein
VITVGKPNDKRGEMTLTDWTPQHIPLGVIVAYSGGKSHRWHLLVWIRPWYRSAGLARLTTDTLLPEIETFLRAVGATHLVARYPNIGRSGGDDLLRTMWTLFFNDLGFVRDDRADEGLRLVKPLV